MLEAIVLEAIVLVLGNIFIPSCEKIKYKSNEMYFKLIFFMKTCGFFYVLLASPLFLHCEAQEASTLEQQKIKAIDHIEKNSLAGKERIGNVPLLETAKAPFSLKRNDLNYFSFGRPDTKVRFGFKLNILNIKNLHIKYEQTVLWKLLSDSIPFENIDFHPSLNYRVDVNRHYLKAVEFIPYGHISNGEKGPISRSRDFTGVKLHWGPSEEDAEWNFYAKAMYHFSLGKFNTDWPKYGSFLELAFDKNLIVNGAVSVLCRNKIALGGSSLKSLKLSMFEVVFVFRFLKHYGMPGLLFSYFNGFGESFLNYKERSHSFRVGLSF